MVDKLLLGLLILLLPIGMIASRFLLSGWGNNALSGKSKEEVERIEQLLEKLADKQDSEKPQLPELEHKLEFEINQVEYSSASGVLQVKGVAPYAKGLIYVYVSIWNEKTPEINRVTAGGGVLGQGVEVRSIIPKSQGEFIYEYPVDDVDMIGVRLEQNEVVQMIEYDVKNERRAL